jgi:hypothetical protein
LWDLRNSEQVLLGGFENVIMTDGCKRSCATHTAGLVIGNHHVPVCVGCCFVMGAAENNNLIVGTATMHNPIKQDLVNVSWAIIVQQNWAWW